MTNNKKISIKDVASHAGVGLGTVSRAINNTGYISLKTKQKVMKSIKELGYTPNQIAQSMRSRKYQNVVFFADLSNITFSRIANGIYSALENKGYMLSIFNIGKVKVLEKIKSFMNGRQFDGIILAPPKEMNDELNKYLQKIEIPVVTLEVNIPGIPSGVKIDYYSSVKSAINYLFSFEHHKILLLCGSNNVRSNISIIHAYKETFKENKLTYDSNMIKQEEAIDDQMLNIISKIYKKEISSILCMSTQLLHTLLKTLNDYQMTYPEDVSLIAIEDYELTQLLNPPLTVIRRSLTDIGIKLGNFLIYSIEHPEYHCRQKPLEITTEFVIRESCRPIKKD